MILQRAVSRPEIGCHRCVNLPSSLAYLRTRPAELTPKLSVGRCCVGRSDVALSFGRPAIRQRMKRPTHYFAHKRDRSICPETFLFRAWQLKKVFRAW